MAFGALPRPTRDTAVVTPEALERAREILAPLVEHLKEACLGHVSEIFDGDAPHAPRGAVVQAWSAAELLRARSSKACKASAPKAARRRASPLCFEME
jgi:glycogen debranching enzyme